MYGYYHATLSKKTDRYGFANENEVRTVAGITLVLALLSFFLVLFRARYDIPLVLISSMVCDFFCKTLLGPKYSIFGTLVRPFLKKSPLWVGAIQKRFAWGMGSLLSLFVLYCILILGGYMQPSAGAQAAAVQTIRAATQANIAAQKLIVVPMNPAIIACVLCIVFMRCEAVLGYCVGCSIYKRCVKKKIFRVPHNQNCVDGSCSIQK